MYPIIMRANKSSRFILCRCSLLVYYFDDGRASCDYISAGGVLAEADVGIAIAVGFCAMQQAAVSGIEANERTRR